MFYENLLDLKIQFILLNTIGVLQVCWVLVHTLLGTSALGSNVRLPGPSSEGGRRGGC